jgi:hypothetical protein
VKLELTFGRLLVLADRSASVLRRKKGCEKSAKKEREIKRLRTRSFVL